MDKISRLQALTGDKNVVEEPKFQLAVAGVPRSKYIYEGTDSEGSDNDEVITSRGRIDQRSGPASSSEQFEIPFANTKQAESHSLNSGEAQRNLGELALSCESFFPFQALKKYPYTYVNGVHKQRVAESFFDQGKVFNYPWQFFYLYRPASDGIQPPILLVSNHQVETFISIINQKLKLNLSVPFEIEVFFEDDGTPRPRYLGLSTDRDMAERLKNNVPPIYYTPKNEPKPAGAPSERSLAAFREKIALILQAQKGKKSANKEKQKRERIEKQQAWHHAIKRVQRYLGLREANQPRQEEIKVALATSGLAGLSLDAATKAAAPPASYHPNQLAPFALEGSVVFICVDVEAYERDSKCITEIGIATLDTVDTKSVPPGKQGENWAKLIRARHFRISEYKHLNNTEFVMGCADRFEFGQSEFVELKDAPQIVGSCFKHPFSKPGEAANEELPKRNIILVGHDVTADINYLQRLGYDVTNLSTLQETADTAGMWRYLKRETNPRNLGSILAELGLIGWNLHNAGNDAVYTLQAMIAIAIKHLDDKQKSRDVKEKEKKSRISEFIQEATEIAIDKESGWSSGGENSDGGAPVALRPAKINTPSKGGNSRNNDNYNPHNSKSWGVPKTNNASPWGANQTGWGNTTPKADRWGQPAESSNSAGRGQNATRGTRGSGSPVKRGGRGRENPPKDNRERPQW